MMNLHTIPVMYTLLAIEQDEERTPDWARARAASLVNPLIDSMALCFRDYMAITCAGEARHATSRASFFIPGFEDASRETVYKKCIVYDLDSLLHRLVQVFGREWHSSGFGGKRWMKLAELSGQYGRMNNRLFVDAVVNRQHNGGNLFNKDECKYVMDFTVHGMNYSLQEFLNFRSATKDYLRDLSSFYKRMEYSMIAPLIEGRLIIQSLNSSGLEPPTMTCSGPFDYTPIKWGSKPVPIPQSTASRIRCGTCGGRIEDAYYKCRECSRVVCANCKDKHNCLSKHSLSRCIHCGEETSNMLTTSTPCLQRVHNCCWFEHAHHCEQCANRMESDKYLARALRAIASKKVCTECGGTLPDFFKGDTHTRHDYPCVICHRHSKVYRWHFDCFKSIGRAKAVELLGEYEYDAVLRYGREVRKRVAAFENKLGEEADCLNNVKEYINAWKAACEEYTEIKERKPRFTKIETESFKEEDSDVEEQESEPDPGQKPGSKEKPEVATAGHSADQWGGISDKLNAGSSHILSEGVPHW